MDLNSDDVETSEEKGEFSKSDEIVTQILCYTIFSLPAIAIFKIKIYDQYMHMIKSFLSL